MDELKRSIQSLALEYLNDTSDDEEIAQFPMSIVGFVLEYAIEYCHFPSKYDAEKIVEVMSKHQNSLAMACVDVYVKAGAEGEKSHSENGIARTYSNSYIDKKLFNNLPNYVTVL